MFDEMKKMVDDFTKEADEFIARYKARAEELEKIGNSDNSGEFPQLDDDYWFIGNQGIVLETSWDGDSADRAMLNIGNCFKTKEEAKQAVKKLKAWKRLKDAGFEFTCCNYTDFGNEGEAYFKCKPYNGFGKDLQLLFGGDDE